MITLLPLKKATAATRLSRASFYNRIRDGRMATFSPKGRIDSDCVDAEVLRLKRLWSTNAHADDGLAPLLSSDTLAALDPFDRVQLSHVVATCRSSRTLSEAGRTLFAVSRTRRTSSDDADRLRKYLQRFGLEWSSVAGQS